MKAGLWLWALNTRTSDFVVGNLVVSGNLNEVLAKLRRIKQAITYRVSVGYSKYQHDENWQYLTAQDERVCKGANLPWQPCEPLHGTIYRGDYLVSDFPHYYSDSVKEVHVNNHQPYNDTCRCTAKWINTHEVLVERLHQELENS